jgi:hypothetical protein
MNITQKHRETCTVISIGLFLIYLFFLQSPILLIITAISGISGLFIPFFRKWIHKAWMGLAQIMGWFVSKILLTIIYFTLLTPIAILNRSLSKNSFQNTGWKERNHEFKPEDLKKIW